MLLSNCYTAYCLGDNYKEKSLYIQYNYHRLNYIAPLSNKNVLPFPIFDLEFVELEDEEPPIQRANCMLWHM